jgi:hypothetical protein
MDETVKISAADPDPVRSESFTWIQNCHHQCRIKTLTSYPLIKCIKKNFNFKQLMDYVQAISLFGRNMFGGILHIF